MTRFTVKEEQPGIVHDETSGLMWSAADVGTKSVTHAAAVKACEKLDLGGFTDWRLPTVEELFLLADRTRSRPAIDISAFPTCRSDWYWSSSPYAANPDVAWIVVFFYGGTDWDHRSASNAFVRAVRSSSASQ